MSALEAAFASTRAKCGNDAGDVTVRLSEHDLATLDPANGEMLVQLHRSDTASCKDGKFLLRTRKKNLTRTDCYAYVPFNTETDEERAAAADAMEQQRAGLGSEPACPSSWHTVLEVAHVLRWTQGQEVFWLAVGSMTELEAVKCGAPALEHVYEAGYCDGSLGRRKRFPSVLKPGTREPYPYVVWLHQVEVSMVTAVDSKGSPKLFVPPLKSSMLG